MLIEADAALAGAKIVAEDAKVKLERARALAGQELITQAELDAARLTLAQADAIVKSNNAASRLAKAQLTEAEVTRARTIIRSPIDGVVINRAVEIGQTLAASFQSPVLFHDCRSASDAGDRRGERGRRGRRPPRHARDVRARVARRRGVRGHRGRSAATADRDARQHDNGYDRSCGDFRDVGHVRDDWSVRRKRDVRTVERRELWECRRVDFGNATSADRRYNRCGWCRRVLRGDCPSRQPRGPTDAGEYRGGNDACRRAIERRAHPEQGAVIPTVARGVQGYQRGGAPVLDGGRF